MELEGLRRTVAWLEEEGLPVSLLVTDRHRQIAKWIRENMPETRHRYDCWHIAKCKFFLIFFNFFILL